MPLTTLRRLVVPLLLLLLALILRSRVLEADPAYHRLLQLLPYVMLVMAAALSVFFNRARLFTAALLLLAVHAVLPQESPGLFTSPRHGAVFSLVSVALPLALLWLMFVNERGLRSGQGALVVVMVPALALIGWWAVSGADTGTLAWLQQYMPLHPYPGFMPSARAAGVMATALVAGMILLAGRGTEDVAALVGVMLLASVALALFDRHGMVPTLFGAAGLNLAVSLLRSSHEMAFRDELTGILGRRALNDRLKGLGRRYAIAMVDVDHFKQFNDTYGHDVGDDVLKMVARQIDDVGGGGTAYRYGGEEFGIVFPGKSAEQCVPHLEEVRRAVARYRLVVRDSKSRDVPKKEARARRGRRGKPRGTGTVSVTISIGLAERDQHNATPEDVIKSADGALYRAKEKGRNCLVY